MTSLQEVMDKAERTANERYNQLRILRKVWTWPEGFNAGVKWLHDELERHFLLIGESFGVITLEPTEKSVWVLRSKVNGKMQTAFSWDGPPSHAYVRMISAASYAKLEEELELTKQRWTATKIDRSILDNANISLNYQNAELRESLLQAEQEIAMLTEKLEAKNE